MVRLIRQLLQILLSTETPSNYEKDIFIPYSCVI
jgi:hypothetical protein